MARHRIIPIDEISQSQREIDERLADWAEWCRTHHRPGHAMSAEGRHRAKLGSIFIEVIVRPRSGPGTAEATNVALLQLSPDHRLALQLRYYNRLPDRVICRMLRLKASSYARFLSDARRLLLAALPR